MPPKCRIISLGTLWLIGQPLMWFRTETHIWGNWLDVMWTSPCCALCVCSQCVCVCVCVCVWARECARADGPAARAAVTRQWDTHVKDFCGSFARIVNTVKFYFLGIKSLLPVHCEITLMIDKYGNYAWNRLGRHRGAPASSIWR